MYLIYCVESIKRVRRISPKSRIDGARILNCSHFVQELRQSYFLAFTYPTFRHTSVLKFMTIAKLSSSHLERKLSPKAKNTLYIRRVFKKYAEKWRKCKLSTHYVDFKLSSVINKSISSTIILLLVIKLLYYY